jgi:hypothetical protein
MVLALLPMIAGLAPDAALQAAGVLSHPERRLALGGYDPVAYFTDGRALKGSPEFSSGFDDALYWFTGAEHRDMFAADPDHYAPQYGGHCAIAIAWGSLAEPDPEAWTIAEGKLYVFAAKQGVALFQQQAGNIVVKANENWRQLRSRP